MPKKPRPEDDSPREEPSPVEDVTPEGDDEDAEPIRLKAHTPIWPIAIAAVVAIAVVVVILVVRPDLKAATEPTTDSTASSAAPTTAPVTGPQSPDPNVLWVPMPEAEREQALTLLDVWAGMDPGSVTRTPVAEGPLVESASVDATDTLVLHGVGRALGTGPCENQQEVAVVESDAAVVVFVRTVPSDATDTCPAVASEILMPVPLTAPLGDRAVLSLNRWTADAGSPLIPLAG